MTETIRHPDGQADHRFHQPPDRPVIVAYLLIVVIMFILINLVVDVLYLCWIRVRLQDMKG